MKKKCQVVMLSTEKATNLFEDHSRYSHSFGIKPQTGNSINSIVRGKQLYILSDDEIKKDDYICYDDSIIQVSSITESGYIKTNELRWIDLLKKSCKKVIATTDSELNKDSVAKIPLSFIEKYISEYNKEIPIIDVLVDYIEEVDKWLTDSFATYKYIPKLRSDNTVIIHKYKTSFTLEEMRVKIYEFNKWRKEHTDLGMYEAEEISNWIDSNI